MEPDLQAKIERYIEQRPFTMDGLKEITTREELSLAIQSSIDERKDLLVFDNIDKWSMCLDSIRIYNEPIISGLYNNRVKYTGFLSMRRNMMELILLPSQGENPIVIQRGGSNKARTTFNTWKTGFKTETYAYVSITPAELKEQPQHLSIPPIGIHFGSRGPIYQLPWSEEKYEELDYRFGMGDSILT